MIEAVFTLFEVEIESRFGDAIELGESAFGVAPERLDAVDVTLPPSELILPMVYPAVFLEAHVHQAVVGFPSIAVNGASTLYMTSNERQ